MDYREATAGSRGPRRGSGGRARPPTGLYLRVLEQFTYAWQDLSELAGNAR